MACLRGALVVGDGMNVDVGLNLEHVGDESAVGVMLEETLKASMAKGANGCGAARGGGGGYEVGIVGVDGGGLAEQLSDAAQGCPLRNSRGLDSGVPYGTEAAAVIFPLAKKTPAQPARARLGITCG